MIPKFLNSLLRFASRPQTVQRDEFARILFWAAYKLPYVSIPLGHGNRAIYIDKERAKIYYQNLVKKILVRKNWIKHLKDYAAVIKRIEKTSVAVSRVSGETTEREMVKLFANWTKSFEFFFEPVIAPYAVEMYLDSVCRELLEKEFGEERAHKYYIEISSPSEFNFYQKMRLKIIDAVLCPGKNKIKNLVRNFGWYNEYSYTEPLFNEKHFKKEIGKLTKNSAKEEKEKLLGDMRENKKYFRALHKKIESPKLKIIVEIIHKYTFLRTDRVEQFKKAQARVRAFYEEVAKRLEKASDEKWTRHEVVSCLDQEILDFLKKGIIPDKKTIQKRLQNNFVYYSNGVPKIIDNAYEVKKIISIVVENEKSHDKIVGLVVSKGKAKGRVVIVHSKRDLQKVQKGDILVAKITMPDYTPAMKKASGFVTEEGGITSHAAIISREFKKPCIVGTGNCTRVLKDGDIVEVDANKGIVKILK